MAGHRDPSAKVRALCHCELEHQNEVFAGTGGVSQNNRKSGFIPAYKNTETGEAVVSCFADGRVAPVHLLEGLPHAWVTARDEQGRASQVAPSVIAGFIRDGVFYTRAAAARAVSDEAAYAEVRVGV